MKPPCDVVAERIALAEPLGDLAEHAASCERCRGLAALPAELSAVPRGVDPGIGFTARMTVGAQHVLAARRRQRAVAGIAVATAVAAGAVFFITRPSPDEPLATAPAAQDTEQKPPVEPATNDELQALVKLARVERSSHLSARWGHITRPLAPYHALVKGTKP
jgi:hypothetical protein